MKNTSLCFSLRFETIPSIRYSFTFVLRFDSSMRSHRSFHSLHSVAHTNIYVYVCIQTHIKLQQQYTRCFPRCEYYFVQYYEDCVEREHTCIHSRTQINILDSEHVQPIQLFSDVAVTSGYFSETQTESKKT